MERSSLGYVIFRHISEEIGASGKKRIVYAVVNILLMVLSVLCAYGIYALAINLGQYNIFVEVVGIILLAAGVVAFALNGVIAQLALVVLAFIGILNKEAPEDRAPNAVAFAIALLSIVGTAVAAYILLTL